MGVPKIMNQNNVDNDCDKIRKNSVIQRKGSKIEDEPATHIDHIIGDFGKYQLVIFLFKILIG